MARPPEPPEWAWIDKIKVGDLLLTPSGDHRMVREVTINSGKYSPQFAGKVKCISLAIRRCSWTGSGYTVINRTDIRERKYKPTGMKAQCLVDITKTTCCEAEGLL